MTRKEFQPQCRDTTHRSGTTIVENRPKIGITMGDAAGIGPEIIIKALTHESIYSVCQPIVIGSPAILQGACQFIPSSAPQLRVNTIKTPEQASAIHGTIDVLEISSVSPEDISLGTIDVHAGAAAVEAIEVATRLAMHGELDAITTAPICKAAINRAGTPYPGHTEMLAAFTNAPDAVMMLCTREALTPESEALSFKSEALSFKSEVLSFKPVSATPRPKINNNRVAFAVSFVTNHIPLADVPKHLSVQRIMNVICITQQALIRCGISEPRLVVAGLNPHAGEEGMFGEEEARFIRPAITQAQAQTGLPIEGPLPADVLFAKATQGEWHAVIAMYHDQGNIPIKLLSFGELVNVTLGLPIIRTSVDHGTAFDIAGKGIANETSLMAALNCAAQLAIFKK